MPEMLVRVKEVTKRYDDRLVGGFFIDKVATRMLVFTGNGSIKLFEGNWSMREASLQGTAT